MSLEGFKNFVKDKPNLINYVDRKEKTWQDFYNMYELYGENSSVWDKYLKDISSASLGATGTVTINDLFNMFKNIDVTSMRESITSLQKGINYINNIVKEKESSIPKRSAYEARPMYKYFDD